jgi:gas vesicle protein
VEQILKLSQEGGRPGPRPIHVRFIKEAPMRATSDSGNTSLNFALGLFCGAAIGAAVGVLLAPKPGAQLRNDVKSSIDDIRRRAKNIYNAAVDTAEDVVERGTEAIERGVAEVGDGRARARHKRSEEMAS